MKIIGIGRNYGEHARELNNPVPVEPIVFMKPDTALIKGNKPFFYPDFSKDVHHELEIVIRICRVGKNIAENFAGRYFEELTVGIDFTARDIQQKSKEKGHPWETAKAFDNSAPVGNFVAKSDFPDIHHLNFGLNLNDKLVQKGNTSEMIFTFEYLIAYVSRFFTLQMGDLIFTGTPAGVGPVKPGDHLVADIEGRVLLDFEIK
ncbi:MAG: fumarylacetoacetate hydrolase family protein [Bacteroidales bacterium]|jgi:2-keto-4-pentenoate hydratase/2-oxohepta-3-ene-1,7-dioic acid hydratase in catechol pathway